jgi:hypothetical protein
MSPVNRSMDFTMNKNNIGALPKQFIVKIPMIDVNGWQ